MSIILTHRCFPASSQVKERNRPKNTNAYNLWYCTMNIESLSGKNIQQLYLLSMLILPHRFVRRHRLASIHTSCILRCHWLAADTRSLLYREQHHYRMWQQAGGDGRMWYAWVSTTQTFKIPSETLIVIIHIGLYSDLHVSLCSVSQRDDSDVSII